MKAGFAALQQARPLCPSEAENLLAGTKAPQRAILSVDNKAPPARRLFVCPSTPRFAQREASVATSYFLKGGCLNAKLARPLQYNVESTVPVVMAYLYERAQNAGASLNLIAKQGWRRFVKNERRNAGNSGDERQRGQFRRASRAALAR